MDFKVRGFSRITYFRTYSNQQFLECIIPGDYSFITQTKRERIKHSLLSINQQHLYKIYDCALSDGSYSVLFEHRIATPDSKQDGSTQTYPIMRSVAIQVSEKPRQVINVPTSKEKKNANPSKEITPTPDSMLKTEKSESAVPQTFEQQMNSCSIPTASVKTTQRNAREGRPHTSKGDLKLSSEANISCARNSNVQQSLKKETRVTSEKEVLKIRAKCGCTLHFPDLNKIVLCNCGIEWSYSFGFLTEAFEKRYPMAVVLHRKRKRTNKKVNYRPPKPEDLGLRFQIAALMKPELYQRVRDYLAYFHFTTSSLQGRSQVTEKQFLISNGLPQAFDNLFNIYAQYCEHNSIPVTSDLENRRRELEAQAADVRHIRELRWIRERERYLSCLPSTCKH